MSQRDRLTYAESASPEPSTTNSSDPFTPFQLHMQLDTAHVVTEVPGIRLAHCMSVQEATPHVNARCHTECQCKNSKSNDPGLETVTQSNELHMCLALPAARAPRFSDVPLDMRARNDPTPSRSFQQCQPE